MDRRSLEYLSAVASAGSVSGAAADLHVSQPAVSKQIARVESELDMRLFHRTASGMTPTAAGESLLGMATEILAGFTRAESVMATRHGGRASFRLACPHATSEGVVTPFLADTDAPVIDVRLVDAHEVDHMLEVEADLAVSSFAPPAHRAQLAVAEIPVMLQYGEQSAPRFASHDHIDLEEVHGDWLIVPRTGVLTSVLAATGAFQNQPLVREVGSGSVAQSFASNNRGFALATEALRFGLRALPTFAEGKPVTITLHASWDVRHYAATEIRRVARSLREWLDDNPPWG